MRAKSGKFNGQDGAYGDGHFVRNHEVSPRLADTVKVIREALRSQSETAVERWFRPEAHVELNTLVELAADGRKPLITLSAPAELHS